MSSSSAAKMNMRKEVLVEQLIVNVPSFSQEDEMPVVGRKYHMTCHGVCRIENGVGSLTLMQRLGSKFKLRD
jgi:hypothetical protein